MRAQNNQSLCSAIWGGRASKNKRSYRPAEYLNRFEGRGTVIAMASESEPRVFWFTRKMILMTSVSMSIRCTTVRRFLAFAASLRFLTLAQRLPLAREAGLLQVEGVSADRDPLQAL